MSVSVLANSGEMMTGDSDITHASDAPEPVGSYPHARRVGNLLFLSGIGPRIKGSREIPGVTLNEAGQVAERDIEAQCHSVFRNVREVLDAAGASWQQLVDVTVFLTHMKEDFEIYNRVYAEYFKDSQPCRTTVEVKSLPTPISIELKCIAALPDARNRS
jgi:2-aminomuconate deaminase